MSDLCYLKSSPCTHFHSSQGSSSGAWASIGNSTTPKTAKTFFGISDAWYRQHIKRSCTPFYNLAAGFSLSSYLPRGFTPSILLDASLVHLTNLPLLAFEDDATSSVGFAAIAAFIGGMQVSPLCFLPSCNASPSYIHNAGLIIYSPSSSCA
ncbi:hypothetical protein BV25DRAFT_226923 [Artomyces pyxidatus]|uniref:Uncharacterized protein n=1 Tax=Artomyces pyxidatus TaxID=48021 RepID=A0ACB8SGD8_9AGAM|nr:hypothetical protein BV25DRAFT_226923 [Artomyces pyxidatus]